VTATNVAALLRAIDVSRVEEVTIFRSGEWDNDADIVASHEDLATDALADICENLGEAYALVSVESPLLPLAQRIVRQHSERALEWWPYDCLVHVGPHSLPDREFEETIWHGPLAVSLHGDRIPLVDELLSAFAGDPEWARVVSAVERATGSDVEMRLVPYY
jgi:hypothetical protein